MADERVVDGGTSHADEGAGEEHGEGKTLVPMLRLHHQVMDGNEEHRHAPKCMCPDIPCFSVHEEGGFDAFRDGVELRTMSVQQELVVGQEFRQRVKFDGAVGALHALRRTIGLPQIGQRLRTLLPLQ